VRELLKQVPLFKRTIIVPDHVKKGHSGTSLDENYHFPSLVGVRHWREACPRSLLAQADLLGHVRKPGVGAQIVKIRVFLQKFHHWGSLLEGLLQPIERLSFVTKERIQGCDFDRISACMLLLFYEFA
jgi:hypothetical protein